MKIKFYGVRGSTPTPGPTTVHYGGNTVCVTLESDEGKRLILDAGTGLRILGQEMMHTRQPFYILLSHNHWDHIQGFPFFIPAYIAKRQITIVPGVTEEHAPDAILKQMFGSYFPVPHTSLAADIRVTPQTQDHWQYEDFDIQRCAMNHPGGGSAYRIRADGMDIVYATDNELNPPGLPVTSFQQWVDFVKGADYLIHDGQFIPDDYPLKHGWGHSLIKDALLLADQGAVKHLVLISHDPDRSDAELDQIAADIKSQNWSFATILAREGLTLP
ncbi:MBL fold metallo-hydrolase [Pseudoalteromonas rubra]|uniref:MBL fold metallo-hydrolase n=1 Tax=Pseudoalteromonas rubra TaxID=43658 RepID=A0A5S3WHN7_9GAMM|nr:MBL fold metallo-hydrolase [Pseudoalteromonas rubra]TMP26711.1 MBL fold metallo-hydrolase [Pseudoalteromonas rubra]TMP30685.1 MBL fold metallo-hydrolase [Pseudoalteromonas rubra]